MSVGSETGRARAAAVVLVGGQLLAAVGALAVNLLAARVLDPSARGDLAYALQLSYFVSVFAVMGLERPFMASRTGAFNPEYRVFVRLITPGTIAVIPCVVIATAFSPFSTSWLWVGAGVIAVYVALNSLTMSVRVAYVTSMDWRRFGFNAIAAQLIIIAGAGLLVILGVSDPVAWMGIYAASGIPAVVLLWLAVRRGPEPEWPTDEQRRALRRRGWVLLPSAFSNTAMMHSDRLLLPILSSSAELGLYVTVATVLQMATWPVQQWVDASLRRWSQTMRDRSLSMGPLLLQSFLLLVAMSAIMGVAAYLMILFVLPDTYRAATTVILPLAIASVIFGLTRVQQGILIALGAEGRVSAVEILGTAVSLLAYVALIPGYGMLGAAYGSIIGYSACAVAAAFALISVNRTRRNP
ncbi:lipopolysaccharide biosynthesis protein [Corynebacterium pacaense]|uniref:lipopolysaccharide biosynthesis protein n=1 Tax=Corynebacterium pacaense TaxID=1816684 RepID=UPI0011776B30|nr:hypothetical protein [Corynebacterium pacaense]